MANMGGKTISEIVTANHKAATVFEKYNLDFCCSGKRTLQEACEAKSLSLSGILEEIEKLSAPKKSMRFNEMEVEALIAYILLHHHFYVKQAIPEIQTHLTKVATGHGDKYPYMKQVQSLFSTLAKELMLHMQTEETFLFPYINKIASLQKRNIKTKDYLSSSLQKPLKIMEKDHEAAGVLLCQIKQLTNDYAIPANACITFKVCMVRLKEFEEDLHEHVHLENYILFPLAEKLLID